MAQHPQSSTPPPPNQSGPLKLLIDGLKWLGLILFVITLPIEFYGIYTKQDIVIAIVVGLFNFLGVAVQFDKKIYVYIKKTWMFGVRIFGVLLIISAFIIYFLISKSSLPSVPTIPVPTTQPSSSAVLAASGSSLIPKGKEPIIDDTLSNNSLGYGWDEGPNAQKTGRCDFSQGLYYLISAPAGNSDIGCNTETSKGNFNNFVYQIKMTILEGIDDGAQAEAGPDFRLNDKGAGYQVDFDQNGNWSVNSSSGALSQATTPFPFFNVGIDQPNFITIRAEGNRIKIQVNGHDLTSFTDSSTSSGFIGVQMNPGAKEDIVSFSKGAVFAAQK